MFEIVPARSVSVEWSLSMVA